MTDFQRLEEIKKILDLSYNKMATAMGMKSPQVFYDIKSGKCGISYDVATAIQEYFKKNLDKNLNVSWLMSGDGTMFKVDATADTFEHTVAEPKFSYGIHGDNNQNNMNGADNSVVNALIEQLKEKDQQIDRLLKIIEKMQ